MSLVILSRPVGTELVLREPHRAVHLLASGRRRGDLPQVETARFRPSGGIGLVFPSGSGRTRQINFLDWWCCWSWRESCDCQRIDAPCCGGCPADAGDELHRRLLGQE